MLDALAQPVFTKANDTPPMVTLRAADYVALLVQAGIMDSAHWPPEAQEEHDRLNARLDDLQDTGERITLSGLTA